MSVPPGPTVTAPTDPVPLRTPEEFTVMLVESDRLMFRVPALITAEPVNELLEPVSVSVPAPCLMKVPEPRSVPE